MAAGQLQEGTLIEGRYRIKKALGQGGMGTVYLAEHERLDTVVAVKEVRGERPDMPEFRTALSQCEQEARFLVRLNHPNLPKVTDAFIENDRFYLVMEYVQGVTLESRLHDAGDKPLDVAQVVDWGLQVADVLAYLHAQDPPIIFRDLKPANIMVQPDGSVRLIDFGIARRFQPGANKDTALLGSVGYSPPEQFGRHQTDTRSDTYAFAATLHHLLTGVDPGQNPFKFTPAHLLNPAVPESLSRLLDQCLAFDADARPATIQEVALRLLEVRDELALPTDSDADGDSIGLPAVGKAVSGPATRPPSARIATADTQKRRSGGQAPLHVPSGAAAASGVTPPASRRDLLIGIVIGILLLIVFPLVMFWTRPHTVKRPIKSNPPAVTPPTPGTAAVPPTAMPQVTAPDVNVTPTPTENPATLAILAHNIVSDGQGGYLLWLRLRVDATGQSGTPGTVAAFFYDSSGNPLPAADPKSLYADRDGQLYVGQSLQIDADSYSQTFDLYVPVPLFQTQQAAYGVNARGVLFLNDQQAAHTDPTPLPELNQALSYPPGAGGAAPGGSERPNRARIGVGVKL